MRILGRLAASDLIKSESAILSEPLRLTGTRYLIVR
jgi:hypothetical protein